MRPDTTSGKARADGGMSLLRSAAFSAVCTAVSATAHAAASGAGVPWWSLLAGWAVTLFLGEAALWWMVRLSRRTAGALLAFVLGGPAVVEPLDAHAGTRRRTDEETGRGETPLLDHAVVRRGPPVPATP
ncbi:Uncharacterised protein [Mycobacterium tuberculosis]|nr:Uncharacterised protein [Mycobacterium tuberculosis]